MNIELAIDEYIKRKRYSKINSVLIWKEEELLTQRYYNRHDENSKNVIKSIAKSIMSIATGIALDKGLIPNLDEPISRYIPVFQKNIEPYHRLITIKHLLTMTSGIYWNGGIHYHCPMLAQIYRTNDWVGHIADCPVTILPGTHYNYKEWDVILLAKVLDVICGDMYQFIEEQLYQPLAIESKPWYKSPCGVYYSVAQGDEGEQENWSSLKATDLLNIGKLFLHDGNYYRNQIVSSSYVKEVIAPSNCNAGYGYLWWRGDDWYGCRGYGGQSITVVPNKNVIIVTQATPTSRGMGYEDLIEYCKTLV